VSQQINLFNPIFRKQKKYFSSVAMAQALAIICVACGLLALDAAYRMQALAKQASATETLLAAREQRLTEVKVQFAPRPKSATLAAETLAAQQELTMLQTASATVQRGGFGDTHGFSRYFSAFARQSIDGLWLTELRLSSGGAAIGIQGNALQAPLVPQYMARLANEPVMKGKAFATLAIDTVQAPETSRVASYLAFSLQSVDSAKPAVAK
jgi:hypothetical protein